MLDLDEMNDTIKDAVISEQKVVANALDGPLDTAVHRVDQVLARPSMGDDEREALREIHQALQEIKKWVGKLGV
jgi:hypothetical protein